MTSHAFIPSATAATAVVSRREREGGRERSQNDGAPRISALAEEK
jgi:hypothetical protein